VHVIAVSGARSDGIKDWIQESNATAGGSPCLNCLLIYQRHEAGPPRGGKAGSGEVGKTSPVGAGVVVEIAFHGDIRHIAERGRALVGGGGYACLPTGNRNRVGTDTAAAAVTL